MRSKDNMGISSTRNITLIAYDIMPERFLDDIAASVKSQFGFPVNITILRQDLSMFFDPFRKQYDGNKLLKELDTLAPPEAIKTIGLFRVDLFIPILTFLFGQAILGGKSGIASLYRLKNELYGLPKNEDLLLSRFTKVVIHELGHTFGLKHCHTPKCVMLSSTYVEDLDQKNDSFCQSCLLELDIQKVKHS